jgi:hypothetical protein
LWAESTEFACQCGFVVRRRPLGWIPIHSEKSGRGFSYSKREVGIVEHRPEPRDEAVISTLSEANRSSLANVFICISQASKESSANLRRIGIPKVSETEDGPIADIRVLV